MKKVVVLRYVRRVKMEQERRLKKSKFAWIVDHFN